MVDSSDLTIHSLLRCVCEIAHRPLCPVFCLPSSGDVILGQNETLRRLNGGSCAANECSSRLNDRQKDEWEVNITEQIGVGCSVKRGILSCSPDETFIAIAHTDGTVTIHSCSDGSFICALDTTSLPLSGDGRWVVAIHFITDTHTSEILCVAVVRLGGVADWYNVSNGKLLLHLDLLKRKKKRGGNGSDNDQPITAACIVTSHHDQDMSILFAADSAKRITMWMVSKKDPWTSSFIGEFVVPTNNSNDHVIAIPFPSTYLSDNGGVDGGEGQLMFPPPPVQATVGPSGDLLAFLDLSGSITLFTICEFVENDTVVQLKLYPHQPTTMQEQQCGGGELSSQMLSSHHRAVSISWWSSTSLIATTAKGEILLIDICPTGGPSTLNGNDDIRPSVIPTPFMGGGKARNSQISCQGSGISAILNDDTGGILLRLDRVSPQVVLERHISRGHLEDAKTFAKEHDLGQDAVHRAVWEAAARVLPPCDEGGGSGNKSQSLTVDHVKHLQKVEDNMWVLEEVISQAPNGIEVSLALLEEGLKRVEIGGLGGGTNIEEKLLRSKSIVEAYQLLKDYMSPKLLPLPGRVKNLGLFRMLPPVPRVAVCATLGCIPALSKLFFHRELAGWRLRILSWIPELVHPREYRHLLIRCEEASELDYSRNNTRDGDDNNTQPLLNDMEEEEEDGDMIMEDDGPFLRKYGCHRSIWCGRRAVEIVCGGSHLLHGVELCETGLELLPTPPDITNEEEQEQWHASVRRTRCRLVRLRNALWNLNCLIVDGRVNACTLLQNNTQVRKWILEMTPEEWGLAIFERSTPETVSEDVQFYVESLLDPLSGRVLLRKGEMDPNAAPGVDVDAVLAECLIRRVNSSDPNEKLRGVQLAVSIVIDSKPTIAIDKRIIKNYSHLANIVLEAAYSEGANDLNTLWQMVECIPVEGGEDGGSNDTGGNNTTHASMDILEQDLVASDTLAKYRQFKMPVHIRHERNKGGKHWVDFRHFELDHMSRNISSGPEALDGLYEDIITITTRGGFDIGGPTGSKLIWSYFLRHALLDEDFSTAWKVMKTVHDATETGVLATVDGVVVVADDDQCKEGEEELDDESRENKNEEEGEEGSGSCWIEYQLLEAVRVLINDASNVSSPKLETAYQCLALLEQGLATQRRHEHLSASKIMNNAIQFERDVLRLCRISNKIGLDSDMSNPSYLRTLLMEQKGRNDNINDASSSSTSIGDGPLSVLGSILIQATHVIDLEDVAELADCIGVPSNRLPEAYLLSAKSVLSMRIDGRRRAAFCLCFNCLQHLFDLCKCSDLSSTTRSALKDVLVAVADSPDNNVDGSSLDEYGNNTYIDAQPSEERCNKSQIFALAMNCCHPHDVACVMDIWHKSGVAASDNDSITIDSLLDMASEGLEKVIVGDGDIAMVLVTLLATEAPLRALDLLDEKIKMCDDDTTAIDVRGDDGIVRGGDGRRTRQGSSVHDSRSRTGSSTIEVQNEALITALQKHGFSISLVYRAVQTNTDGSLSSALQWCLDHTDDTLENKLDDNVYYEPLNKADHPLLRMSDNSLGSNLGRSTEDSLQVGGHEQRFSGMVGLFVIKEAFQCLDAISKVSAKERTAMAPAPVYAADLEVLVHIVASFAEKNTSALHSMTGQTTTLSLSPLQQEQPPSSSLQEMQQTLPMPEQQQLEGLSSTMATTEMTDHHRATSNSTSSLALARLLPQYLTGASQLRFVSDVKYRSTCLSDLVKRAFVVGGECQALPLAIFLAQDTGGKTNAVTPLEVCKDALWQGLVMGEERESESLMAILKVSIPEEGITSCAWDILVSNPQDFLLFLWNVYGAIDGKALSKLNTDLLLTLNVLSSSKRESGLSLIQAKAIRANHGLLRRLTKVGVAGLDFKCLVGPDPSQWGTCNSTELGEKAIMELRGCLDPSHVAAVSKLASRLGGLLASDIYMATATRVLCGVTEDIRYLEGLDRLRSPSLDAPEDVQHAWVQSLSSEEVQAEVSAASTTVFLTLQPFIQKLNPMDAVCLLEGVCVPGKDYDWCRIIAKGTAAEEGGGQEQHAFLHPLSLNPKSRRKLLDSTVGVMRSRKGRGINSPVSFEGGSRSNGKWNEDAVLCQLGYLLTAVEAAWPTHSHVVEMAWRSGVEGIKDTLIRLVNLGGLSVRAVKHISEALVLSGGNGRSTVTDDLDAASHHIIITVPEVYRAAIEDDLRCIVQLEWPKDEITYLVNNVNRIYESVTLEYHEVVALGEKKKKEEELELELELLSDVAATADNHSEVVSEVFEACNIPLRNFCTTFEAGESPEVIKRRRMVLSAVSKGGVAPWDMRNKKQELPLTQQKTSSSGHVVVDEGGGGTTCIEQQQQEVAEKIETCAAVVALQDGKNDDQPSDELVHPLHDTQRQSSVRFKAGGLAAVELISRHFNISPSPLQCSSWQGRLDIIKEISEKVIVGDDGSSSCSQLRVMCEVLFCWLSEDERLGEWEGQYHRERDLLALRQWVEVGQTDSTTMDILEGEDCPSNSGNNTNGSRSSTLTPLEYAAIHVLETLAERFVAWTLVLDIFAAPLMQMVLSRSRQKAFISCMLSRVDHDKDERKEEVEGASASKKTCHPPLHIVVSAALSSRYSEIQRLVSNRMRMLPPEVWNNGSPLLPSLLLGSCILFESFGTRTFAILSRTVLSHSSVMNNCHVDDGGGRGDENNDHDDCHGGAAMPLFSGSISQTPAYLVTALTCSGFYGPAGAILLEALGIGRKMRSFDLALHWLGVCMSEGGESSILPVPELIPEIQLCWDAMRMRAAAILDEDNPVLLRNRGIGER